MTIEEFIQMFHQLGAYSGVVVALTYLVLHTVFYDWHKTRMGWMLNSTLLFIILIGLGATLSSQGLFPYIVKPILGIGWFGFAGSLIWRVVELVRNHKDHIEVIKDIAQEEKILRHLNEDNIEEK